MDFSVDIDRLSRELDQLAEFSDVPAPAVQRVLFSDVDLAARKFFINLCTEAGLAVRVDAVGNIFARLEGREPDLPPVGTGSHTDAIPYSGKYDGAVGVLGGLEALRTLQRAGPSGSTELAEVRPRRPIELIMFTAEEPTRFALGCLGSRLLSGQLAPADAAALRDEAGVTLEDARKQAGCTGRLEDVPLAPGAYAAFIELHIEQGPLLEQAGLPIAAVTSIAAPAALRVRYNGPGGHAGGVLMADRHDPLLAGAQLALDVERLTLELGGADTVATVGVLDVHPRAVNSIPRDVALEIDVRDVDGQRRDRVVAAIRQRAEELGRERGTPTTVELINADVPAACDESIIAAIEDAADAAELASRRMVSRAYHDSLFMARVAPISMIFIPCRDGVSHRPDEYASPEAIRAGVEVLARTLATLAE